MGTSQREKAAALDLEFARIESMRRMAQGQVIAVLVGLWWLPYGIVRFFFGLPNLGQSAVILVASALVVGMLSPVLLSWLTRRYRSRFLAHVLPVLVADEQPGATCVPEQSVARRTFARAALYDRAPDDVWGSGLVQGRTGPVRFEFSELYAARRERRGGKHASIALVPFFWGIFLVMEWDSAAPPAGLAESFRKSLAPREVRVGVVGRELFVALAGQGDLSPGLWGRHVVRDTVVTWQEELALAFDLVRDAAGRPQ